MRQDWTMRIYVMDRRCKEGERIRNTYSYKGQTAEFMEAEIKDLQRQLYPAPKFRIEVDPVYYMVKSLMTGEPVQILYEDRGTCNDPSQERYWTL
mgnify:CR=1 FL=1